MLTVLPFLPVWFSSVFQCLTYTEIDPDGVMAFTPENCLILKYKYKLQPLGNPVMYSTPSNGRFNGGSEVS